MSRTKFDYMLIYFVSETILSTEI